MTKTSLKNAYAIVSNSTTRKENDYYPTPPIATQALLHYHREHIKGPVWEPAAGRGWISHTLQQEGLDVVSTDLYEYENPLVDIRTGLDYITTNPLAPNVITNPPYRKAWL